jgi:hypothetical protein
LPNRIFVRLPCFAKPARLQRGCGRNVSNWQKRAAGPDQLAGLSGDALADRVATSWHGPPVVAENESIVVRP